MSISESLSPELAIETLRAMMAGVAGVSAYDVFVRRTRTLEIRCKNQELSALREAIRCGLALRLSNDKSCVVVSTENLSSLGLKELLIRGKTLLRGAQQGPFKRILPIEEMPIEVSYDGSFEDATLDEKVSRVVNMSSLAVKASAKYPLDVKSTYFEKENEEWLWIPGAKRTMTHKNTWGHISARVLQEKTHGSKGFEVFQLKTQYFDLDWSGVARAAAAGALTLSEAQRLESGKYPVILEASVFLPFVRLLGEALRADRILSGRSFLDVSQLDKRIFSEALTLIDDPERSSRAGYRMWDAEGRVARKQIFIDKGVFTAFALDCSAGYREGYATNHQAVRPELAKHPHPGFHSLHLPAESRDLIDLRKELDKGLWIQGLDSLSLIQPGAGEFIACFSGQWIEKGEPVRGLTGILVRGDLKSLFSKIVSVSRDMAWSEHTGTPSVLVSELEVIGT
jgi:PmbA protein